MAIARRLLVPEGVSRCYHCVSRCVRRAFLCDDRAAHRKEWIKQRLMDLDRIFAIETGGFAIMGNHLHLLVRTQPAWVEQWSAEEVVRRWLRLYPKLRERVQAQIGVGDADDNAVVERLVSDESRVEMWRKRLCSLSWFMKCLKEPIARRANREDRVTGHFWEGRFKVHALLDEAAVLACMAYIDLNPIRAGLASTPERSSYTSVQDRIHVRQWHHKRRGHRSRAPRRAAELAWRLGETTDRKPRAPSDEDGVWLIPVEDRSSRSGGAGIRAGLLSLTLGEYLELIDLTGRLSTHGKRGAIPSGLPPILARLELNVDRWLQAMLEPGRRIGTAIGSATSLAAEAARRGTRWVVNACRVQGGDLA